MPAQTISVLLVDDHDMVLAGLRTLLKPAGHIAVAGEARTGAEAVRCALQLRPDVVLMDLHLPDMTGVDACREILDHAAARAVLFVSSHSDEQSVLAAFFAGATGYFTKEVRQQELLSAIEAAAGGGAIVEQEVIRRLRRRMSTLAKGAEQARKELDALSAQERRILSLVVEGKTNKEIAAALRLSNNTVKNYLSNTFQKLRVNRRAEAAARFALELQRKQ
ncbi:MAG TPA: response regulator transcription factor [Burkholderiales bacterium]|nr:response regulator transcription factor [Burkholderiales bacterium]